MTAACSSFHSGCFAGPRGLTAKPLEPPQNPGQFTHPGTGEASMSNTVGSAKTPPSASSYTRGVVWVVYSPANGYEAFDPLATNTSVAGRPVGVTTCTADHRHSEKPVCSL